MTELDMMGIQGSTSGTDEMDISVLANLPIEELAEKPDCPPYEDILKDIIQRDYQDMHREIAPLKQAEDAVLVDTTELNLEQSAEAIVKVIKDKTGREA